MTAKRFYGEALELWPSEEPGRAHLLFRYGRALRIADDYAADEALAEARDALLVEGDRESAAEAETVRAEFSWYLGRPAEGLERLERASRLVEDVGPSGAKIRVLAERARLELFAGRTREAIDVGREALEMAEALEDDQWRAELLNTIGVARFFADESDRGSLDDLEQSVAIARTAGAPQTLVRCLFNVAETQMMLGDARASRGLFGELREVTKRFGLETFDRWQRGSEPLTLYLQGRWDDAASRADEFIAEIEAGSPHYQEGNTRVARGKIRLGRGDVEGALEDARRGADFARAAGDHQLLQPNLSFSAWVHAVLGETAEASVLADQVLEFEPLISSFVPDLAWAMRELGRGGEFLERALPELPEGKVPSLWRVAARAVAADELEHAAEVFAEIGSAPDEAYARLLAAEERGAAGPELDPSLAFFREVGATAYLERGAALLAKSA